jgi:anaerobic ribonucleoside-triphosphate reductase
MKNKLDAFNKDKRKCEKCKEYYDKTENKLCVDCNEKWIQFCGRIVGRGTLLKVWSEFLNE